jgi:outer membrane protein TolC
LIQAQNTHEKAKADMIAFLGIDVGREYTFDFTGIPSDIDTTEFAPLNAKYSDYQTLVGTAIGKRPDYQGSVETLNGADASVSMARASYLPTISASGSFGYSGFDNVTGSNYLTDNRSLGISLSASLPIFNGFSRENQIEQAQVGRMNAEELVKQNGRQVRVDVRKALLDLEAAEKEVKVSQTTITSALMDRQIAEEKYNLGSGTLLDLLTASANYTIAVSNKVSGVVDYLTAKKQMEYVLGVIVR